MSEIQTPRQYIHSWHYDMLINESRNHFYSELIRNNCRDKVVFEIGTGSGLLSALAIKYGAKQVICCEENPVLAGAAKQLFKRLKLDDRIQLIAKNSTQIKTEELPPVDVILHELFGTDPFGEDMIPTLSDARRFMKPDGIFLPEKMQIIYQPIFDNILPKKIAFDGIELIEMSHLLSQIHPSLRARDQSNFSSEGFSLPEISIKKLLSEPYVYTECNDRLIGIDALEVSFMIIHKDKKLQAAKFEPPDERVHWRPMVFYKLDSGSNKVTFSMKNQNQLVVL